MGDSIKELNATLPESSRIKKFVNLHKDFDPDEAEKTRTGKIKRSVVEEKYKDITDAIYGDKEGLEVKAEIRYRDGRRATVTTFLKIGQIR